MRRFIRQGGPQLVVPELLPAVLSSELELRTTKLLVPVQKELGFTS